ncbi:hypothetical protein SGPA1_12497 [Streptomyces misionensis JCM 4497]
MALTRRTSPHEGQAERQEDLRQVQGDPPSRPGHGHLREPAPQAAPGLTHDHPSLHLYRRVFARRELNCSYAEPEPNGSTPPVRRPGTRSVPHTAAGSRFCGRPPKIHQEPLNGTRFRC